MALNYIGDRVTCCSESGEIVPKDCQIKMNILVLGHQPGSFVKIVFAEIANPTYVTNNMTTFMTRAGIKLVASSHANPRPNPIVLATSKIYHAHFSFLLYAFKIIAMVLFWYDYLPICWGFIYFNRVRLLTSPEILPSVL